MRAGYVPIGYPVLLAQKNIKLLQLTSTDTFSDGIVDEVERQNNE